MDNLILILQKLDQELNVLDQILQAEYQLLSVLPLQPIALQEITNSKSKQLSIVAYYDKLRLQEEFACNLQAPYRCQSNLNNLWMLIQIQVSALHRQNLRNEFSLETQMIHARSLDCVIKKLAAQQMLYCADGSSCHNLIKTQNIAINA